MDPEPFAHGEWMTRCMLAPSLRPGTCRPAALRSEPLPGSPLPLYRLRHGDPGRLLPGSRRRGPAHRAGRRCAGAPRLRVASGLLFRARCRRTDHSHAIRGPFARARPRARRRCPGAHCRTFAGRGLVGIRRSVRGRWFRPRRLAGPAGTETSRAAGYSLGRMGGRNGLARRIDQPRLLQGLWHLSEGLPRPGTRAGGMGGHSRIVARPGSAGDGTRICRPGAHEPCREEPHRTQPQAWRTAADA